MKRISLLLTLSVLAILSCNTEGLTPENPGPVSPETVENPDRWHDKRRTEVYPKMSNELYINPSPLIVPQSLKTGEWLQFALSQDSSFPEGAVIVSDTLSWCMFNPHRSLSCGKWYWKYRNISSDGTAEKWSDIIEFEVKAATPVFVTPEFRAFAGNIPHGHPRLLCFLDPYIDQARDNAASHEEYGKLISRAETACSQDFQSLVSPYNESNMEMVRIYMSRLYQAYHVTGEKKYAEKMREVFDIITERNWNDTELFYSNFGSTDIAYSVLSAYDMLYDRLDAGECRKAEEILMRIAEHYIIMYRTSQENNIFDNHFWQRNMRILFQTALCLCDKPEYAEQATYMLEYYYELWTARAPASGFNRDGAWTNGTGYFNANIYTLAYMPKLLSFITRTDFHQHPWYRNAGEAIVYSWPPDSKGTGFGDSSEDYDRPHRSRVAFADYLARELKDPFAGWYAGQCHKDLIEDTEMRIFRMCLPKNYSTDYPADMPKLKWYKDIGEVVMHSDLADTGNNLTVSFRSSTFGSGSHTLADQNSFNIIYRGEEIYYHSGYYTSFSDRHNLLSYRHTRAHNSILVNGIGQPFSSTGYGMLLRADGGDNIGYCIGDASNAYRNISDDPMWIQNFRNAGIEQSEANGFGPTPLSRYRRQILTLYPDIVLVYDDLAATEPVKWEWLLHSPTQFDIDGLGFTSVSGKGTHAQTTLFTESQCRISATDEFFEAPPAPKDGPEWKQWHLTATVENSKAVRFLAVIQLKDGTDGFISIERKGTNLSIGDWEISVNLNPNLEECFTVKNTRNGSFYNYGHENISVDGTEYIRQYTLSSILHDSEGRTFRTTESIDSNPISTRSQIPAK